MKIAYALIRDSKGMWYYDIYVDGKKFYESFHRFKSKEEAMRSADMFVACAYANPEVIEEDVDDV